MIKSNAPRTSNSSSNINLFHRKHGAESTRLIKIAVFRRLTDFKRVPEHCI